MPRFRLNDRVQGASSGRRLSPESFQRSGPTSVLPRPARLPVASTQEAPARLIPAERPGRDRPAAAPAVATRGQQANALPAARRRSSSPAGTSGRCGEVGGSG